MEDAERLADIAIKLEWFRYNVIASLIWAMFGMVFGSALLFAGALQLIWNISWTITSVMLVVAGIVGGYLFHKFWMFIPKERVVKQRWRMGLLLMFIPFIITYALIPALTPLTSFYFSVIWYPSLGAGLLFSGLYVEKDSQLAVRNLSFSGALMLLSALALIPISWLQPSDEVVLGANLLTISMMIAIYLIASLRGFFGAQRVIQE